MPNSNEIFADLWASTVGDPESLVHLKLSGDEPQLPSTFRVAAAAQIVVAAAGLAAAELWRFRTGAMQDVAVDMRHAVAECRSERYLRVLGQKPPPTWDAIAGVYSTRDGRFVRLHTNFLHHREAVCRVLACDYTRDAVQSALMKWDAEAFETAATKDGGVVAMMRSYDEWTAHPQGKAIESLPVLTIERIGDAPPRQLTQGNRPLSGVRILDLSRVIAGPVAGRTLAAHGADVMLISNADLPSIPWLVIDTGRGKLSTFLDLKTDSGRDAMHALLADADVFLQGYRPKALAKLGFSPHDIATIRPGVVYASLSAYGPTGPWAERRGFDSLVQTVTGLNQAEGEAAGTNGPKELPAQILDHCTGYLMAFGTMLAKMRQAREGGSWHVQVSLAQTARWLWSLGRIHGGLETPDQQPDSITDLMEDMPSGFGPLRAVRHAALMSHTPAHWERPTMPLGFHPPRWP